MLVHNTTHATVKVGMLVHALRVQCSLTRARLNNALRVVLHEILSDAQDPISLMAAICIYTFLCMAPICIYCAQELVKENRVMSMFFLHFQGYVCNWFLAQCREVDEARSSYENVMSVVRIFDCTANQTTRQEPTKIFYFIIWK